jgi:hypothetical protein
LEHGLHPSSERDVPRAGPNPGQMWSNPKPQTLNPKVRNKCAEMWGNCETAITYKYLPVCKSSFHSSHLYSWSPIY